MAGFERSILRKVGAVRLRLPCLHWIGFAFVAFGGGNKNGEAELELTYNHGVSDYDLGTAYGHIALGVDNVAETCERIREAGGNVTREPGPVKGGSTVIAFVEDPDGYKVELIETGSREI